MITIRINTLNVTVDPSGASEELRAKVDLILTKLETSMATLDDVIAKITEQDTALDSVRALITGLRQQIADVLNGVTLPPAVQAKVDAAFAQAEKNSAEIAEALAENVPAPTP